MAKQELLVINKNQTIKQSNRLIEAKYKLTNREQLLIMAICSQLDENAENFSTIRIKVADFAAFCKITTADKYTEVKRIVMRLLDRKLLIQQPNGGWYATHWLQSAEYIPNESVIEYKIDERLKPELLQLKSGFLRTKVAPIMEFRRDYSIRIYFILKKMLKIRDFCRNLDFFRERFELGKSYNLFANLKNKVLEPALKEINEKSDISVWHEYIKEGRAYKKIHFIVELKETEKKEITPPSPEDTDIEDIFEKIEKASDVENYFALPEDLTFEDLPEWTEEPEETSSATNTKKEPAPAPAVAVAEVAEEPVNNWSDEQQADFDALIKCGVWAKTAIKIVETYDHARIERNRNGCVLSNPKGNIRDLGAVVVSAINSDIYQWLEEAGRKAREREEKKKKEELEAQKRAEKEKEEQRCKEQEKMATLEKIREQKSKEELIAVLEDVLAKYKQNNDTLSNEMVKQLELYGIPQNHFSLYKFPAMRKMIKYIQ